MEFRSIAYLYDSLQGVAREIKGGLQVVSEEDLRDDCIDILIHNAVFNSNEEVKKTTRLVIKQLASSVGIRSASIQGLYDAMGRGECKGFTVPAVNIRGLTYDTARALFRSAKKHDAGAFIFEIAKSEIGYTDQRPAEYTACVIAAAIKENWKGPVFIQGDHFQVNAKNFAKDKDAEVTSLKDLIKEAIDADFYNIDIDASTVVDLSKPSVPQQQEPNFATTAILTNYIRANEPAGVIISVGGEIGEVGGKNSTEEELCAFMEGFNKALGSGKKGISKISIQTGTSHGGVPMPDGTIAKVKVDFDTIEKLSVIARKTYGLAGAVQHGASTLPDDAFDIFPKRTAAEVHLATGFQNMVYDSASFPPALKEEIYAYLKDKCADEKKAGDTEEQFIYKTRKKGFGPFKRKFWDMDEKLKLKIGKELEARFDLLFDKLNCKGTNAYVKQWVG
ncbi:aldolase [bacterium]|nr:MAG: aldolase [bacterium]